MIMDTKAYYGRHMLGSLYVKTLDSLFAAHLLEKIEEEQRQQEAFETDYFNREDFDTLDVPPDKLTRMFLSLLNEQEESTAGMQAQIAKYTEEADSLDRTLHFGASKLDGETIEKYSERLANLRTTLGELTRKQKKAEREKEQLLEFADEVGDVVERWHKMGIEKQRRFVRLATRKIVMSKPAPNWLQIEIVWLWGAKSMLYIWQRQGANTAWTPEENRILERLYSTEDRVAILASLPARTWSAIVARARQIPLRRYVTTNTSVLHPFLSVDDDRFMQKHGIVFDAAAPEKYFWWIPVIYTSDIADAIDLHHWPNHRRFLHCMAWSR